MSTIPECPHSDEPMAWLTCPPCQRDAKHGKDLDTRPAKRLTSESAKPGTRTTAKFNGYCKAGRDRITQGDEIVMTVEHGWTHEGCAP